MKTTFPKLTTLRKGFTDVNGVFVCTGSYMGRSDTIPEDTDVPVKLSLRKLKLNLIRNIDKYVLQCPGSRIFCSDVKGVG